MTQSFNVSVGTHPYRVAFEGDMVTVSNTKKGTWTFERDLLPVSFRSSHAHDAMHFSFGAEGISSYRREDNGNESRHVRIEKTDAWLQSFEPALQAIQKASAMPGFPGETADRVGWAFDFLEFDNPQRMVAMQ